MHFEFEHYVDDNMRNIPDHYHAHARPGAGSSGTASGGKPRHAIGLHFAGETPQIAVLVRPELDSVPFGPIGPSMGGRKDGRGEPPRPPRRGLAAVFAGASAIVACLSLTAGSCLVVMFSARRPAVVAAAATAALIAVGAGLVVARRATRSRRTASGRAPRDGRAHGGRRSRRSRS